MKARLSLAVMLAFGWITGSLLGQAPDALTEALALAGLERGDLGWTPKAWWPQFPADIQYKLRAFDSLFDEPLDTVAYTRSLAEVVDKRLDPSVVNDRLERGATPLFHAVHRLGINPKFGGLRGYTANLTAEDTPLDEAILALHQAAGRPTDAFTFYMDLPYPKPAEDLAARMQVIPENVRPVLGRLVMNIVEAHRWAELAFRKVDGNDRIAVARRLDLGEEMIDAYDYAPEVDDVARALDEASLWYAAQQCVQALDDARIALAGIDLGEIPGFAFDWASKRNSYLL